MGGPSLKSPARRDRLAPLPRPPADAEPPLRAAALALPLAAAADPGGPALAHRRLRLLRPSAWKSRSAARAEVRFGRFVWIGDGSKIRCHEGEVEIGEKTVIGQECTISAYRRVRIGEQCVIADRAMFIDFDHGVVEVERPIRVQGIYKRDVEVGSNVWIGYGACILRGVHVGDNSIVGTNSRGDQGRPRQRRRSRHPSPDHPHAGRARAADLAAIQSSPIPRPTPRCGSRTRKSLRVPRRQASAAARSVLAKSSPTKRSGAPESRAVA